MLQRLLSLSQWRQFHDSNQISSIPVTLPITDLLYILLRNQEKGIFSPKLTANHKPAGENPSIKDIWHLGRFYIWYITLGNITVVKVLNTVLHITIRYVLYIYVI